jgi:hypothetical protein
MRKTPRIGVLLPLAENDPEQAARRDGLQDGLKRLGRSTAKPCISTSGMPAATTNSSRLQRKWSLCNPT